MGFLADRWPVLAGCEPSAGCATHTSGASAGVAGPARAKQVSLSMWPLPAVSMGFFVAWNLRGGRLVIWGLAVSEGVFHELWEEEPRMAYLSGVIDGGSH